MIILVNSCEKYSDCWRPFLDFARINWPQCPCPKMLVTDHAPTPLVTGFSLIELGSDHGWCANLQQALQFVADDLILLLQEDFWITDANNFGIQRCVDFMAQHSEVSCLRITPIPGCDGQIIEGDIGLVTRDAEYRISCQAAIWRREYLLSLLNELVEVGPCTASDFECEGTKIAAALAGEVASWHRDATPWPFNYICSAVSRGAWNLDALEAARKLGVAVDRTRRPIVATA